MPKVFVVRITSVFAAGGTPSIRHQSQCGYFAIVVQWLKDLATSIIPSSSAATSTSWSWRGKLDGNYAVVRWSTIRTGTKVITTRTIWSFCLPDPLTLENILQSAFGKDDKRN